MSFFTKIIILFISFQAFAKSNIQDVALGYMNSLDSHNKEELRKYVSKDLYIKLNKNDLIDRYFKKRSKKKRKYKVKITDSKLVKGFVLVRLTDEKGETQSLKLVKNKQGEYKVQEILHLD
ncbi:MAG: hypothetical protein CME64_02805 [Halobacteriovoraceae bacterium]|nr:hypothetical protein [Halobacteriovoraceae bacterium]|tara:strand:+ start:39608 stop:39970 length:363 start_codon:yes stop_codon:yes gene_type:complete